MYASFYARALAPGIVLYELGLSLSICIYEVDFMYQLDFRYDIITFLRGFRCIFETLIDVAI